MWSIAITGAVQLLEAWFAKQKTKQQAEAALHLKLASTEADWDLVAQRQAQYSWKDEFITLVWFAPMIVAWFAPKEAMNWIQFVTKLPYWYQFGMFGILSATFGLRWYFKQQNFKRPNNKETA